MKLRDVWESLSSGCGCHLAPVPLKIPLLLYTATHKTAQIQKPKRRLTHVDGYKPNSLGSYAVYTRQHDAGTLAGLPDVGCKSVLKYTRGATSFLRVKADAW